MPNESLAYISVEICIISLLILGIILICPEHQGWIFKVSVYADESYELSKMSNIILLVALGCYKKRVKQIGFRNHLIYVRVIYIPIPTL